MPGRLRTTGLACAIVLIIAGCGGGDDATIPSDRSQEMLTLLEEIEREVQNGDCEDAQERATTFAQTVNELPGDVDSEVRQGLSEASVQLVELTRDPTECTGVGATGEGGQEPAGEEPTTVEEEDPVTTTTEETDTTTDEDESEEEEGHEQPPPEEEPSSEGNGPPLTTPSGNTPGGGGRGATDSGGVEPEKGGGAQRSRPAPLLRRLMGETP